MDRLSAVVAIAVFGCACNDASPPPAAGRVDAVKAKPLKSVDLDAFCDVRPKGRAFQFPALAGGVPDLGGRPTWVNVWATWCKPCVEELPMLARWHRDSGAYGLVFVSADESDEAIAAFRSAHPEAPAGSRVADVDALADWFVSLGLDQGATLPLHIFVDAGGSIRCVRSGGVQAHDRAAIGALLSHE